MEPDSDVPLHLCRLRYFRDEEAWSLAFYTYSHEKYEPCLFGNGSWHGTPEEAFEIGAMHLLAIGRKPGILNGRGHSARHHERVL